ncbi:microcin C transport system substrate-binding protein [Bradyrhizobium japonicum]|jgi:microcin C transport system substrate-binding protein|uniref:extracellular solute-binding protein n=1 Tax=Bradyrhizobium TaxID=374 RepID=UPI000415F20F|nr:MULTISPECIES: extracellular solute-binding protein [Bradyrhizobium]MBR0877237.1 ABC transporter substrate-binding protein [Bradyrhizobium liaoningense]MBR0946713.1 ABC transporter substrate-binding protein [Bradyrhizobium liaoningense]MBR0998005.1 ABC transporter substrate-binding protein [Bradyrhizobium liaoningense]MBR1027275.1 ABC transporter substrate-binding protein [Bradyrhizobium liaoningense]MBR1063288.1 ABC transporter substrate-binding protein [Bradyrhizobium liaoningense]
MAQLSRRHVLALGAGGALSAALSRGAVASELPLEVHGISAFGDLKYPADFHHFDYVNLDAPKGGTFSLIPSVRAYNQSYQTFNSLNAFILKGDGAQGMDMTFVPLMVRANDEPDAMYGLAAKSVQISPDRLVYRFTMRPEAKFHDGTKLSAQDAAFSLMALKTKGHPLIILQMRDMVSAEAIDDATLVVTFAKGRARDVPLYVAGLPIFSKTYYASRAFDETSLDTPLGSGPYKVGKFEVNRYIEYERVKDWWAADLPVCRGSYNFDVVRYEFYRDRDVAFEGFTGKNYLYREEFTSRIWATRYDFPAVKDGRVKMEVVPDDTPSGAQGWFINTRRDKFKDPRVREALIDAFDFEWTNKTIMYGAYARTVSPFQNSDLMASNGPPSPEELKLLEPFRGQVPDEVFATPFTPPISDGSGQDRSLLRKAQQLLAEAGMPIKDGKRVLPNGDVFRIEFLLDEPSFQPHHAPYIKNLGTLGIEASVRLVDAVQHKARQEDFDFDMTIQRFSMSATPGDAMRSFFSSQVAATKGSYNLAGVASPAIDAMIEKIMAADNREDLTVACRAFDRLFRAGRYWVPQWYNKTHRLAYWDQFAHPQKLPRYANGVGAPEIWWHDNAKAAKLEQAK